MSYFFYDLVLNNFVTNSNFRGEFSDGLFEGNGTYIWRNGRTYRGEWEGGESLSAKRH